MIKTSLGAQRYNNRMNRIFEEAKRLQRLRDAETTEYITANPHARVLFEELTEALTSATTCLNTYYLDDNYPPDSVKMTLQNARAALAKARGEEKER